MAIIEIKNLDKFSINQMIENTINDVKKLSFVSHIDKIKNIITNNESDFMKKYGY